jgi:hypothetical protein
MSTPTELLYPKNFSELLEYTDREERDGCVVSRALWTKWTRNQTAEVLLIELKQRHVKHILVVEGHHSQDVNNIYLPQRCMMDFDAEEYIIVKVLTEMPPLATKITLQPLDNELYHCDIATAVSEHLSKWSVLTKNVTLTVPLKELGGYLVDIFVKDIEPAETVLLRGEVPLELAESIETIPEWTAPAPQQERPPTPRPEEPPVLSAGGNLMIPMPTQELANSRPEKCQRNGAFVPFSGVGHRLCDP